MSGYFLKGVLFLMRPALPVIFLFILLTVAGMTGIYNHAQLFLLRWGLQTFSPKAVLEPQSF
jgi:hypothetical protein